MALGDLLQMFEADSAEAIGRRRDDTQLATARQRDGAAQDMRVIGGVITQELLTSDDAESAMGFNAAVRVPTTLDHPSIPVQKT